MGAREVFRRILCLLYYLHGKVTIDVPFYEQLVSD